MWTVNLRSPRSQYQTCQLMYLQCQAGSKFLTITLHPPGCWNGLCCAHRQVQVPPRGILHRLRPGRRGIQHRRGCQILWRQAFMLDMLHSKDNFCTKQALFCTRQVAQDIPYHHCKTKDWVLIKGWQNTTLNDYVRSQVSIFWKVSKFTGIGVRNTGTKTVLIHVKQCYITLPSPCKMVLQKLEVLYLPHFSICHDKSLKLVWLCSQQRNFAHTVPVKILSKGSLPNNRLDFR